MAHPRNMGYRPSRGRIRPERILRGGSTATDLSPRRLSWHTGCVPAEPINTLSGRTLGRSCKVALSKLTTTGFSSTLDGRILDPAIRIPCGGDEGSQPFRTF